MELQEVKQLKSGDIIVYMGEFYKYVDLTFLGDMPVAYNLINITNRYEIFVAIHQYRFLEKPKEIPKEISMIGNMMDLGF